MLQICAIGKYQKKLSYSLDAKKIQAKNAFFLEVKKV